MEEKELFYYQKAKSLLTLGMSLDALNKELEYFQQSLNTAAIKGYKRAIRENSKFENILNS